MRLEMVLPIAIVFDTMAVKWETKLITLDTDNTMDVKVTATFYERGNSIDASDLKTITTNFSTTTQTVDIPDITRPIKIVILPAVLSADEWKSLKLTMKSSEHNFTFECECSTTLFDWSGVTLLPKEDKWKLMATTGVERGDRSAATFDITLWDSSGFSNKLTLYAVFDKGTVVTFYLTINLDEIASYVLTNVEKSDGWGCTKLVFIQIMTCRSFTFGCTNVKHNDITSPLQSVVNSCATTSTTFPATDINPTILTETTTTTTVTNTTIPTATDNTTTIRTATDTITTIPMATDNTTTIPTATDNTTIIPTATDTTTTIPTATTNIDIPTTSATVLPCCPCVQKPAVNMTSAQLTTVINELKTELSVNETTLSATIRKKTSAIDSRTSSKAIGSVGAVFLAIPIVFVVVMDLIRVN